MGTTPPDNTIPVAKVRHDKALVRFLRRSTSWFWLLAFACLILAGYLTLSGATETGPLITVFFRDGHGLKPEDALRFRGIDVGYVEDVRLKEDLQGVDAFIRLHHDAASLAREGSQFWVERPQLSLARLSGLETVVGAKFVGVIPGDDNAPAASRFVGLDSPPTLRQASDVTVLVHFREGYGIKPGDLVKYRGIIIGEVSDVRLTDRLDGVQVKAKLMNSAKPLARKGSIFWVERPNVSLKGIRGLDTLVGGQYLAVLPDPDATESETTFEGTDNPPPILDPIDGGLLLTLESEERYGLERGASITYRGMPAGQVTLVELAPNGHAVNVQAVIFPEFRELVRDNSKFWSRSGVDFHFGLGGLDLDVDPLTSLTSSGIAFATPEPAGVLVESGDRFELLEKEVDDWKDWKPALEVGKAVTDAIKRRRESGETPLLDRLRRRFRDQRVSVEQEEPAKNLPEIGTEETATEVPDESR